MKSFMKYCLRYFHLLTKVGQQAELLERILRSWTCCPKSNRWRRTFSCIAGKTIHQTRPERRKVKMDTRQTGGHLTHRRRQNTGKTRQEDSFGSLADTIFGGQNAPRGGWCKGNFCTAKDRELETLGSRAGSTLRKVKRSKHNQMRSTPCCRV